MKCTYTYEISGLPVTLTADQLFNRMRYELKNNPELLELASFVLSATSTSPTETALDDAHKAGLAHWKDTSWDGVSHFQELKHDLGRRVRGSIDKQYLSPIYDKKERIKNSLTDEFISKNGGTREAAEEVLKQIIAEEEIVSEIGMLEHALLEIAVRERVKNLRAGSLAIGTSNKEYRNLLTKVKQCFIDGKNLQGKAVDLMSIVDNGGSLSVDQVIAKLNESVLQTEEYIFKLYQGKDVIFYPEYIIGCSNKTTPGGIKGKIDLLVLHADGTVDIIDYKLSTRSFDSWDPAKRYHVEYQMAIYRLILAAHGVDGSKVNLYAFPIHLPGKNILNLKSEGRKSLTDYSFGRTFSRVDWKHGTFTEIIQRLLPTKTPESAYVTSTSTEDIQQDFRKVLVPFETTRKSYNKEVLESRIFVRSTSTGVEYVLYDIINPSKQHVAKSKEEFTKENGIIDRILKSSNDLLSSQVAGIKKDFESIHAQAEIDPDKISFLDSQDNLNAHNVLQSTFLKYCDGDRWELLDCEPLLDLGIFVFKDTYSQLVEVVRMSDEILSTPINHHGTSHVLGKFLTNEQAQNLRGFKALEATAGNMKLMETLVAINRFPKIFEGCKLSAIKVINCTTGEALPPESLTELMDNFNFLLDQTKDTDEAIQNNFKELKIKTVEPWEMFESELLSIVRNKKLGIYEVPDKLQTTVAEIVNGEAFSESDVDNRIKQIKRLMRNLKHAYPKELNYKSYSDLRSFLHPAQVLYFICSLTLSYYEGVWVTYSGKLTKWGLQFEEIVRWLGIPFMSNYKSILNNGFAAKGFLQGLDMSTPAASPSESLSLLFLTVGVAMDQLRHTSMKQVTYNNNLTLKYVNRKESKFARAVVGSNAVWEDLIKKDADGNRSPDLKFLNPYTETSEFVDPEDIEFLKEILWEINKYLLPGLKDEERNWRYKEHEKEILELHSVKEWMETSRYFNVPLRKASDFDRARGVLHNGIAKTVSQWWDSVWDEIDPRQLHATARTQIASTYGSDATLMYNQYDLSPIHRTELLEKEGVYSFEIDLSILASDVAFQHYREILFNDVLLTADAVATVMHFVQLNSTADFDEELQYLDDEIKVAIKNESIIDPEVRGLVKGINVAKRINSLMVLGVRPMQMIKELTYGQFINYSRAFALKGTDNEISAKSLFSANRYVFGNQIASWMKSMVGQEDIAAFTLCLLLNLEYGIANQDSNSFIQKNTIRRTGLSQGLSKYMFIFQTCPDFFNRMSLFVAKMIEDGCFDAHSMTEDGYLQYDFKKDKRFAKLNELGWDSKSTDSEYLQQKALYRAMVDQFKREGFKNDQTGKSLAYADLYLPRAYTVKQKLSMKEVSDLAYGFFDHETKSLNDHKFFGVVFKQFMAFWTAKTTLWFRGPGANTAQGKFAPMVRDGQLIYVKYLTDEDGNIIGQEYVTDDEGGTLEPVYEWVGEYCEGLMYSLLYTIRDVLTFNWKHILENKSRLANLKLALHDLLIGLVLYKILLFIFSGGTNKLNDASPLARTLIRATQDVGPSALLALSFTPSFVSTAERLKDTIPDLLTGDLEVSRAMRNTLGMVRDFAWAEN